MGELGHLDRDGMGWDVHQMGLEGMQITCQRASVDSSCMCRKTDD